ncbi:toxin TcdB middle/N-terminal domain-containing protein [Neorhizobium petrolearium]|uniref:Toxin TcdB middle/N-terminal domain-containing protein n=3 Tax=Neorhizobium TaxID=1525371 RepID=A0ABY8MCC9_9HYPH|nr:toxin TcdB middle/N-terminal domain-containing protein [Neorhizobium petrolearium]WGI72089.1 toxin TcdB middle/N-terminal domain-containing protein [Neorhizobium petrolearium]
MRDSRVRFAALAATVSLCVLSGGVTGAVLLDGMFGGVAFAGEQGPAGGGFGSGGSGFGNGGLGGSSVEAGQGGSAGASGGQDEAGQANGTALGKPADDDGEGEEPQADKADAEATDENAAEPQAMTAMAAAATSQEAPAVNAPERPSVPEIGGNGFFTQKIAIDVPAFRGLEPKIALSYSSARKTRLGGLYQGWLGYAWGLDGFDVIERASPGYGYPYFDANDVYLLNGEELVACAEGMVAASCTAGGTHVTENENFKRVSFDAAANTWTVTDRDGTVSLFKSVMAIAGTSPASGTTDYKLQHDGRYLLTQVKDTNGQVVNYGYSCPDLPGCYAKSISYSGAGITFYYEDRPDFLVMANGLSLSYTKKRVKTISVKVGTAVRNVYALTYDQAPFSNTSRLVKVDRYGKDATVAADGTITGTTVKTIRQMTYDNLAYSYAAKPGATGGQVKFTPNSASPVQMSAGDFNSDGKDELYGWLANTSRCWEMVCDEQYLSRNRSWRYVRFNNDGTVAGTFVPEGEWTNQADPGSLEIKIVGGRFVAGRPRDTAFKFKWRFTWGTSDSQITEKHTEYRVGRLDQNLNMSLTACSSTYSAVCAAVDQNGAILDHDGDGLDKVIDFGKSLVGAPDFAGNGLQGVLTRESNAVAYRFANGAWATSSTGVNCGSYRCVVGDLNGDGAPDILRFYGEPGTNYSLVVYLSTGKSFVQVASGEIPGSPALLDVDSDGRVEILAPKSTGQNIALPTRKPWRLNFTASGAQWRLDEKDFDQTIAFGDFNGDGLPDVVSGTGSTYVSNPGAGNPNLLRTVKFETGGSVAVDYTPSTRWTNVYMPQVLHAVTKLTVSDGRTTAAVTDYAYAGGLYDPKARKFLGYKTITVTKPLAWGETTRPVVEITYRQDLASYGLPAQTVSRDAANTASKKVVETYAVNAATKPYRALNTRTDTTLTEGSTSLVLRKDRIFDAYGNITQLRDVGRTDLTGDETWTVTSYAPNTTAYIVSLPRQRNVRSGGFSTSTDVYERHQAFYYDGSTDNAAPPAKGNLTILRSYKSVEPTSASYLEYFTFDAYGNRLSHVDGVGNRTEWDYDATYHLHVVKERAPKYFVLGGLPADTRFVTSYTPDYVCGKPASKVDWNGVKETFTYDAYCRPYGYTNAGTGKYVNTRYIDEGIPATQSVVVYEPLATGSGNVYTRTYYDGLARQWRVQTPPDVAGGATRVTDTRYDARGNVGQTAATRFSNEASRLTVNYYDWNDRVVKVVNPDASQRTYAYNVQPATAVGGTTNLPVMEMRMSDEEGKVRRTYTDKDNNVILTSGNLSGTWVNESRTYDVMGRLRGVRDHSGATWTYTYDLVGNRLTASDPDLGNWSYTYDNANRLVSQTDARGAVTTLAYDQMGRLRTKSVKGAGETAATVTATNTYDTAEAGVGAAPFHDVGLLTVSSNGFAKHSYSRSLTGSGTKLTTKTVIDGITHTTVETRGRAGLTLAIAYSPAAVNVGTASAPWTYNISNRLLTVPGQTTSISYANGVSTTFAYAPERRWLTRVTTKKGTTVLMDNQYTVRDKLGRIKAITGLTTADSWTYTYDDLGRLTKADNLGNNTLDETYSYSVTGNLTSRTKMGTYTYPAGTAARPHAATKIGTKTLSYDANGNMLSDGTRTLVWDRSNLLGSVTQSGSAVTFAYGPDGARAMKTWAFGKTLYASADVEIDRTTPGAEIYTRYPHPDLKVTTTAAGATTKSYLHRDHLASVRLVTNDTGTPAEQTAYAAYGQPTNTAMQTRKGYIGERFDAETGLMYLNARYYDPAFGRFIPKDDGARPDAKQTGGQPVIEPRNTSILMRAAASAMAAMTNADSKSIDAGSSATAASRRAGGK